MIEVWIFRFIVVALVGLFAYQILVRYRVLAAAPGSIAVDDLGPRVRRFVSEVIFQTKVIRLRPWVGVAHLFVFWGFCAFGLYTAGEILHGLGFAPWTHARLFHLYKLALVPFSLAVLLGIVFLLIRRGIVRPPGLGATLSKESILIGFFIAVLMITFLIELRIEHGVVAQRVNWWVHMLVVLTFLALIPNSKHLHLLLSPITIFLEAPILGTVPNLDFEKEEVGLETVKDLPKKQVLDAFTCVECGRCQDMCPANATGKLLNPKQLILQNQGALLGGRRDEKLVDLYDPGVLWQCTTCGACENECPVGIEHLPDRKSVV